MKKLSVLLLCLSLFSCKSSFSQVDEHPIAKTKSNEIKARLIICTGLSEKNIPLDNLNEITVNEGGKIYLYVKWFNLHKGSFTTSMEILDENDTYLSQSSNYKFKASRKTHNTWSSRTFREVFIPAGTVKFRIILDSKIILERKVNVTYVEKP
ncbi:MAG: hypothetical protein NWQ31_08580 [Polaribacter sp.]|nr:hypothetical protein [Polaribacter sp.]